MRPLKVTYIVSDIHKALAFEWIAQSLDAQQFSLSFILLNPGPSALEDFLRQHGVPVHRVTYRSKKDFAKALVQLVVLLRKLGTQAVHCHFFDASLLGLSAAWLAGVRKRIYTRHYSTFHHEYFPKGVYYDRLMNRLATGIVSISGVVSHTLTHLEGVKTGKVHLVHHGFKLAAFTDPSPDRVEALRRKYLPEGHAPVIGVISRYFELKGIQYIIPAFKRLMDTHPGAKLLLANAVGNYSGPIKSLLAGLPPESYAEIPFEEEIAALYQLFDVFVHVPINEHTEAFGQIYVEALAAGIPSVFTRSGVATEFIEHGRNAWVVPFKDEEALYQAMRGLLADGALRNRVIAQGRADVLDRFALQNMIAALETLYVA